jgi:hypothetical protein
MRDGEALEPFAVIMVGEKATRVPATFANRHGSASAVSIMAR